MVDYVKKIPALDPDGDNIKFRIANNSELGGGTQTNPAGFTIDENSGILTWYGSGNLPAGLYSGGIVVEDFDLLGNMKSRTHYDIMFELIGKAEIVDFTGHPDSAVVVKKGDSYTFSVTGTNGSSIEGINLGDLNGALVETGVDEFTFTPGPVGTGLDLGIYPVTFQVIDPTGTYIDNYFTVTYIVPDPMAPELHDLNADESLYIMGDIVQLDVGNNSTSTDLDSPNLIGGQLRLSPAYKDPANEHVYIESVGDGPGEIRVDIDGKVYFEGVEFGQIDATNHGVGMPLQINFTTVDALPSVPVTLMRSIRYQNNSGIVGNRQVSVFIKDDTGLSNIYAVNTGILEGDGGDALLAGNDAFHGEYDMDQNNIMDLKLGDLWDPNFNDQNALASADDIDNLEDEDGVSFPSFVLKNGSLNIDVDIQEEIDNGRNVYIWLDMDNDGVWEASERYITDTSADVGNNAYSIPIPNDAELGFLYLRVRLCSSLTVCDTPNGVAYDGEVEDYRVFVIDLSLNSTCDQLFVTESLTSSGLDFTYSNVTSSSPTSFQFSALQSNITNYPLMNALAFNNSNGFLYSTYRNTADNSTEMVVTDSSGTNFISMGKFYADDDYVINQPNTGAVININEGDFLPAIIGDAVDPDFEPPTSGTITQDGETYYATNHHWDSVVIIDVPSMTFSVKTLPAAMFNGATQAHRIGSDWAISAHDGLIYGVDLTGNGYQAGVETAPTTPKLYRYDPVANTVTTQNLNFNGAKAPNYWTGAVIADDSYHLYAMTAKGDHDTNKSNAYDLLDKVGMYRINMITGEASFIVSSSYAEVNYHDAAGCFVSVDRGDAPSSYGQAGHRNYDLDTSGAVDLMLGSLWDPDIYDFYSNDALGDNDTDRNDEDGIVMPDDIIVESEVIIPITVTGAASFLNIFVDLTGDGTFDDPGERVVHDHSVNNGVNNVPMTLYAALTGGHNGDTFIRFRLCDAIETCDSPTGIVANGEVEDDMFNLINQIKLSGSVFEDNGKGGVTAHDGVQTGDELGLANFSVVVIYNDVAIPDYAFGQQVEQTATGGDGRFTMILPVALADKELKLQVISQPAWIDISESDVTDPSLGLVGKAVNTSVVDSFILVTAAAGDILDNFDFGRVSIPKLTSDNFTSVEPGGAVMFSHRFTMNTSGPVNFTIKDVQEAPSGYSWTRIIHHDLNCDGTVNRTLDPITEPVLSNPITMNADTQTDVCLFIKVLVPVEATFNALARYDIEADLVFSDDTGAGHNQAMVMTNTDTLKVTFNGAGELELVKTVKNITQGGTETTNNQARPGDVLEYVIYFSNGGVNNISDVVIFDGIPAFSQLHTPVDCSVASLTSQISTCSIVTSDGTNTVGYQGSIQWQLQGIVLPGEEGSVSYQIQVE